MGCISSESGLKRFEKTTAATSLEVVSVIMPVSASKAKLPVLSATIVSLSSEYVSHVCASASRMKYNNVNSPHRAESQLKGVDQQLSQ